MEAVIRAIAVYLFLLVLFRVAGKRTLSQITTFDFVLLLIISEATQNALTDNDRSLVNSLLLVSTLIGANVLLGALKQRSGRIERLLDGTPLIIAEDGKLIKDRADRSRIDESDVLSAARQAHGLERMEQIKYAVLERSGGITVVPKPGEG